MDRETESKSFMRDLKFNMHKERIVSHVRAHQKKIAYVIVTIIAVLIIWTGWCFYSKIQSEKYSAILHQVVIDEQQGNLEKATASLKEIYDSSAPAGVKEIASLKYASHLLANDKNDEAIEVYLNTNKSKRFDNYIREYAGLLAVKTMISSGKDKEKIAALIKDLEKNSKVLKYNFIEQRGMFAWDNENYKEANDAFKILADNPEASDIIKKRAKDMVEIYNSRFPEAQSEGKSEEKKTAEKK